MTGDWHSHFQGGGNCVRLPRHSLCLRSRPTGHRMFNHVPARLLTAVEGKGLDPAWPRLRRPFVAKVAAHIQDLAIRRNRNGLPPSGRMSDIGPASASGMRTLDGGDEGLIAA